MVEEYVFINSPFFLTTHHTTISMVEEMFIYLSIGKRVTYISVISDCLLQTYSMPNMRENSRTQSPFNSDDYLNYQFDDSISTTAASCA